ncbi:MAG: hypothetical protein M1828_006033 [Chrysothrix sp. TS-e1954]|nr:MAG: hypothetical protein M1828_006033 [Chrysothrix sp. TS-e1954]
MAGTLPRIRITDPQTKLSSPLSATIRTTAQEGNNELSKSSPNAQHLADSTANDASQQSDTPYNEHHAPEPTSRRNIHTDQLWSGAPPYERPRSQQSIDPLSQHIVERTSPLSQHKSSRSDGNAASQLNKAIGALGDARGGAEPTISGEGSPALNARDKRKSISFLSRFTGKKKRDADEPPLQEVDMAGDRPEGVDAQVFSHPFDNMGFHPRHPQPPGYIKVHSRYKKEREFNKLFLAQELRPELFTPKDLKRRSTTSTIRSKSENTAEGNAIWALEFSLDGKYLASTGQDKVVRLWSVLSSRDERRQHERAEEEGREGPIDHVHLSAPVFRNKPFREYEGHTAPVLDLSWSKNHFLLSSSMDKTVRLWHASRTECLCAFKHSDFVTSIQFHPKDDRFFLAGSLDSKLRLWSIPDKSVAFWNQLPEMVTAVAFTPDGKTAIAGCLTGLCHFYETEGLRYQTQIHVKSAHGKNAKGSKITGIKTAHMPPGNHNGDVKLMVTSNDSRIRLYNLRDKSLEMKFKGNENTSAQMHGRFSDDVRYVICGSEDKKVYIWSTTPSGETDRKYKFPVDMFEAHSAATTVSILAPTRTRQFLSASEDPIYDLCNPPPIMLRSRSEVESTHSASHTPVPENGHHSSSNVPKATANGTSSIQTTPSAIDNHTSTSSFFPRPAESPAYLARTTHPSGNIIITADANGAIKIFRQDCAHEKRIEATSTFGRRVSSSIMRRTGSLQTQRSGLSRQNSETSFTQPGREPGRERILSWRQSIASSSNASFDKVNSPTSLLSNSQPHPLQNGRAQTRSESPRIKASSLLTRGPRFNRQGSAVSTTSSAAHPPSVTEADRDSTRKSSIDTASASNGAPALSRGNSTQYWAKYAWKDEMMDQLKASRGRHSHGKDGTADGAAGRGSGGNGHLAAPQSQSRGISPTSSGDASTVDVGLSPLETKMSGASALSSNVPSDVEEGSGNEKQVIDKTKKGGKEVR